MAEQDPRPVRSASLDDKYTTESGRVYLTGYQALVRLPMIQRERDQAAGLKNLNLVPRSEQVSEAWLGGGEKSGVAKILKETSAFLKEQKKISQVQGSYAKYVTPTALK